MIDFVDAPPFLRITLRIVMATMHLLHISPYRFIFGVHFFALRGSQGTICAHKNFPWGARYLKVGQIRYRCKTYRLLFHQVLYFILF